jgi:hypothetical protein
MELRYVCFHLFIIFYLLLEDKKLDDLKMIS